MSHPKTVISPFSGRQEVWKKGYEWVEGSYACEAGGSVLRGDARIEPVLIPIWANYRFSPNAADNAEIYDPSTIHVLHKELADLEPEQEAILAFANRRGLLGWRNWIAVEPAKYEEVRLEASKPGKSERVWGRMDGFSGETVSFWQHHISKVKLLMEMLVLLRKESPDASEAIHKRLEELEIEAQQDPTRIDDDDALLKPFNPFLGAYGPRTAVALVYDRDPFEGARHLLEVDLNVELRRCAHPAVSMEWQRLGIWTGDLLSTVYADLALDATGQVGEIRRCPSCGTWFEVTHGRQTFCEDKCKSRNRRRLLKEREAIKPPASKAPKMGSKKGAKKNAK